MPHKKLKTLESRVKIFIRFLFNFINSFYEVLLEIFDGHRSSMIERSVALD